MPSGRQVGSKNKATVDVRALAQQYGEEAVDVLADVMRGLPEENLILEKLKAFQVHVTKEFRAEYRRLLNEIEPMGCVPPQARVKAADSLLDRGWGSPTPMVAPKSDRLDEILEAMGGIAPVPDDEEKPEEPPSSEVLQ